MLESSIIQYLPCFRDIICRNIGTTLSGKRARHTGRRHVLGTITWGHWNACVSRVFSRFVKPGRGVPDSQPVLAVQGHPDGRVSVDAAALPCRQQLSRRLGQASGGLLLWWVVPPFLVSSGGMYSFACIGEGTWAMCIGIRRAVSRPTQSLISPRVRLCIRGCGNPMGAPSWLSYWCTTGFRNTNLRVSFFLIRASRSSCTPVEL